MIRVQYYIGTRDTAEVFASLYETVSSDDVTCATTSAGWGTDGKDIILLSKTPTGDAYLTFMVLKWSHLKDFTMDQIPA